MNVENQFANEKRRLKNFKFAQPQKTLTITESYEQRLVEPLSSLNASHGSPMYQKSIQRPPSKKYGMQFVKSVVNMLNNPYLI